MAAQQLSHRGGAGPRDPGGPSARLLPGAAQAVLRRSRGLSARVRAGVGLRRAHGQPDRARDAAGVRPRLPAGPAADDRRTLGAGDFAEGRARREPPASLRTRRRPQPRARRSRPHRRPAAGRGRQPQARAGRSDPDARVGALLAGVRGPARPAAARAGSRGHTGARLARPPADARHDDGRRDRARRAPGADRQPRDGAQRDHEHAPAVAGGLGGLLREREPRARGAVRGHARGGDGLSDAGPLPARRRGARAGKRERRAGGGPAGRPHGGRRAGARGAPPWRPRLLPDRERTRGPRARPRVPGPGPAVAAPRVGASGDPALPRRHRARDARHRFDPRCAHDGRRGRPARRGAARPARSLSRLRPRHRAPPSLHHPAHGPAAPAQARARAGRAGAAAHARRHPDAPDRREGDRRRRPQAGSPCSGQLRSGAAVRAPLGLGGCSGRVAARRRRAAGARAPGDRGAQRAARSGGRRRRPILGAAPTPDVERGRGRLDGLGAQARQAARVEPPPARSDRHVVPATGSGRGAGAVGHPLRDHARRRFAPAPRGGAPARGNDRASAQPARIRRRRVARRRRPRPPPAPGDAHAAGDGMGHALPARLLGPEGHRPVRLRGVRRLPGSLR